MLTVLSSRHESSAHHSVRDAAIAGVRSKARLLVHNRHDCASQVDSGLAYALRVSPARHDAESADAGVVAGLRQSNATNRVREWEGFFEFEERVVVVNGAVVELGMLDDPLYFRDNAARAVLGRSSADTKTKRARDSAKGARKIIKINRFFAAREVRLTVCNERPSEPIFGQLSSLRRSGFPIAAGTPDAEHF